MAQRNKADIQRTSIYNAYAKVFSIPKSDVEGDTELSKDAVDALVEVWQYDELLPGEVSADARHMLKTPQSNDWTEMSAYLRSLPDNIYKTGSLYEPVMQAYKVIVDRSEKEAVDTTPVEIMPEQKADTPDTTSEVDDLRGEELNPNQEEPSNDSIGDLDSEIKETKKQEENKMADGLKAFQEEIDEIPANGGAGTAFQGGTTPEQSKPEMVQATTESYEAADAVIKSTEELRTANSLGTKVTNIVKPKRSAVYIAVKGREATGTLLDDSDYINKAWEMICNQWGKETVVTPVVVEGVEKKDEKIVFRNVSPASQEDAKTFYDIISRARSGDSTVFAEPMKVYFSESKGTTKGYVIEIEEAGQTTTQQLAKGELTDYLVKHTLGFIGTKVKDNVQVQLASVTRTASKESDGKVEPTTKKKNKKAESRWKGLYSHRFTAVSDEVLEAITVYVREIDKQQTKIDKGFKTELKVAYTPKATAEGQATPKGRVARLSLKVDQYALYEVESLSKFIGASGVAAPAVIDIETEASMASVKKNLLRALAVADMKDNGLGKLFGETSKEAKIAAEAASKAKEKANEEVAKEIDANM